MHNMNSQFHLRIHCFQEITQLKSARDELEKKINELEDQTKHTRLLHQEEVILGQISRKNI